VPFSVWAATRWLEGFAYHTALSWWLFGISGILSFLIALVTISVQALRVAIMNPVKSLRAD
jgi:putative ABC transport system permease protein